MKKHIGKALALYPVSLIIAGSMVDFITVYSKDDNRVIGKDGTEIRA